jgi:hypothetical protein
VTPSREIQMALGPLQGDVAELRELVRQTLAINAVLIARFTDVTHLSIAEVARIRKMSRSAVRRRFRPYIERLEGSKGDGVPIDKVFVGWLPIEVAKKVVERTKAA